jgi:hypothetical protein
MPIRYRRFYIEKLVETNDKQNEEINRKFGKEDLSIDGSTTTNKLPPPPIPDFVTKVKAPKK